MDLIKQEETPGSSPKKNSNCVKKHGNKKKSVTNQSQNKYKHINDFIIFSENSSESDEYDHTKELNRYRLLKEKSRIPPNDTMNNETTVLYKNENIGKLLERSSFQDLPVFLGAMNLEDDDSESCPDDDPYMKAKKKRVRKRKVKNPQNVDDRHVFTSTEVCLDYHKPNSFNELTKQKNKKKSATIKSADDSFVGRETGVNSDKNVAKSTRSRKKKDHNSNVENAQSVTNQITQRVVYKNMPCTNKIPSLKKQIRRNMALKNACSNKFSERQLENNELIAQGSSSNNVVFDNFIDYSDTTSESSQRSDDSEEFGIDDHSKEDDIKKLQLTSKGYIIDKENKDVDILSLQAHFLRNIKSQVKTVEPKPILELSKGSSGSRKAERKLAFFERRLQMAQNPTVFKSKSKENLNDVSKQSVSSRRKRWGKLTKQTIKKDELIEFYEDYISVEDVTEGLQSKNMIEGYLRINPRKTLYAYVNHTDLTMRDVELEGIKNRNRALDGDLVVVLLLNLPDVQRQQGKVVFIKERNHPQVCVGNLIFNRENDQPCFIPRDKRMPQMFVPLTECPPSFNVKFKKHVDDLYLAKIVSWVHTAFVIGTIVEDIGSGKLLKNQNKSIMLENRLDTEPYGDIEEYLPAENFEIPEKEFIYREDFRNECVFTIDPPSARDLDDAVSCKILDNGNYEIGVHISDVTYYLLEGTPLDEQVAGRATTVYLVDETYHMLPKQLCLHCSLLPNCDKLTFSVIWEITKDGAIINHRFTRSIMNSCCQLSYDHVTRILESGESDLIEEKFPQIKKPWTLSQVCDIVRRLHEVAVIFRKKRYNNGALRINQTKLSFQLDPVSRDPIAFYSEEHNESHQLIEEFMLLANCTVAARIHEDFPNVAFLRAHPPPKDKIQSVIELFQTFGVALDATTSGDLQASIAKLIADDSSGMKSLVLDAHLMKTLSRAKYFCSDGCDDDDSHHYALNIPIYTHFTSPIRRYADVVVHRLLSASLQYNSRPLWTPDDVKHIAKKCNSKNYSAKNAGDSSSELYLMKYILNRIPLLEAAVVIDIYENSMEVIIISMGLTRRIYFDNFSPRTTKPQPIINKIKVTEGPKKLSVVWPAGKNYKKEIVQTIEIFSVVNVVLNKNRNILSISSNIVRPTEE